MLYYLFNYLDQLDLPGAGVFQYISFRAGMAAFLSLLITITLGKNLINYLRKKQVGEAIRDLGLEGLSGHTARLKTAGPKGKREMRSARGSPPEKPCSFERTPLATHEPAQQAVARVETGSLTPAPLPEGEGICVHPDPPFETRGAHSPSPSGRRPG